MAGSALDIFRYLINTDALDIEIISLVFKYNCSDLKKNIRMELSTINFRVIF